MQVITQDMLAEFEQVSHPKTEISNFKYSFSLLPREERSAINSVYAFFSYIDNIVDEDSDNDLSVKEKKLNRLAFWEKEIIKIYDKSENSKFLKPFVNAIERFVIPKQYFLTLIDGCRTDLVKNRFNDFEELKLYCYQVASTVGLTCIEIFGYKHEQTKSYAINLGYALQLTNILRDIKADKDRGYIYLPQEDLKKFNYSEEDLMNEVYNDNFIDLMRFQVQRARDYYHKARTSLRPDERSRMIAAGIMDDIYFRILEKIELNDFNIWDEKIRVSNVHKVMMALKHWLSIKLFVKRIKE